MTSPARQKMRAQLPPGPAGSHVALSARDLAAVGRILALILDPFAHPSVDEWRAAVLGELMPLLGADKCAFLMPIRQRPSFHTINIPAVEVSSYPTTIRPLDRQLSVWERQAQLGAFDRASLWHGHQRTFLSSPYYNEFVVPQRLFDATGLTARINGRADAATGATLWFHHDRDTGRGFGDRALAILRLLVPAVSAATRAIGQYAEHADSLARTIDALGIAAAIYETDGRLAHQTPRLTTLLAADAERSQVLAAARQCALSLLSEPELRTANCGYRLEAVLCGSSLADSACRVIITITPLRGDRGAMQGAGRTAAAAGLRQLTSRECQVASLIAEGLGIQEITRRLGVSRHTVRHHVESVFRKLDVHTHAAACVRIRGLLESEGTPGSSGS